MPMLLQAFEKCVSGEFNLSQNSLQSRSLRQILAELPTTDSGLWAILTQPRSVPTTAPLNKMQRAKALVPRGVISEELLFNITVPDDSSISIDTIIKSVVSGVAGSNADIITDDETRDDDEDSDYEPENSDIPDPAVDETVREVEPFEGGRGKRIKKPNPHRNDMEWWSRA